MKATDHFQTAASALSGRTILNFRCVRRGFCRHRLVKSTRKQQQAFVISSSVFHRHKRDGCPDQAQAWTRVSPSNDVLGPTRGWRQARCSVHCSCVDTCTWCASGGHEDPKMHFLDIILGVTAGIIQKSLDEVTTISHISKCLSLILIWPLVYALLVVIPCSSNNVHTHSTISGGNNCGQERKGGGENKRVFSASLCRNP